MNNLSKPEPPNKSEGCFQCGQGKDRILLSITAGPVSIAVCEPCYTSQFDARFIRFHSQPFNTRSK